MLIQLTDTDNKPFVVNTRYLVAIELWQSSRAQPSEANPTYTLLRLASEGLASKLVRETPADVVALAREEGT